MSQTIAVLGTGRVGSALAGLWAGAGHTVLLGSRDAVKATRIARQIGPTVEGAELAEAMRGTDLVVEALPFPVSLRLDAELLNGKTLISASNYHPQWNGSIDLQGLSHTEAVARRLPKTDVVKAFNMHWANALSQRLGTQRSEGIAMLFAGGSSDAKALTKELIDDAWFEPVDAGPLSMGAAFQPGEALYADKRTATPIEAIELLADWHLSHAP